MQHKVGGAVRSYCIFAKRPGSAQVHENRELRTALGVASLERKRLTSSKFSCNLKIQDLTDARNQICYK